MMKNSWHLLLCDWDVHEERNLQVATEHDNTTVRTFSE